MNRRTVLGSASALAAVGLAGCVGNVQQLAEGFLQSPVPIEIYNEGNEYHNVYLVAHEVESGRQSYDQGFSITPGERVIPEHLSPVEQRLRVIKLEGALGSDFGDEEFDEDDVEELEEVEITPETRIVLIRLQDDGLEVDVQQRERESS
ncbi:hypothetical protein [Natronobeatus ordinarius]|uniref:hypothetical protein n=1 Tax=Natronobeatus ordinarius TaxID=2963433 RepID=UPI0020CE5BC4|nr:hypothetical protein [Natronobeatus ordinarius]